MRPFLASLALTHHSHVLRIHGGMQIMKRTLNWLPRASLYAENESLRAKRRANLQSDLANSASVNSNLIAGGTSATGDSINLTLRIAAARIQNKTTKRV